MSEKKQNESASSGCCSGADFKFPACDSEKMAEMMKKFCGEDASCDREAMFQMMMKCCASPEKEGEGKE